MNLVDFCFKRMTTSSKIAVHMGQEKVGNSRLTYRETMNRYSVGQEGERYRYMKLGNCKEEIV